MKKRLLVLLVPVLLAGLMFAAVGTTFAAAPETAAAPMAVGDVMAYSTYAVPTVYGAALMPSQQLSVTIDTSTLFTGAQTMLDALTSPYLLIAGFGLGVAILAAVMKAVTSLRL